MAAALDSDVQISLQCSGRPKVYEQGFLAQKPENSAVAGDGGAVVDGDDDDAAAAVAAVDAVDAAVAVAAVELLFPQLLLHCYQEADLCKQHKHQTHSWEYSS